MAQVKINLAAKQHPPFDEALRNRLLDVLSRGAPAWNAWRQSNPDAYIDLRHADLFARFGKKTTTGEEFPLPGVNLSSANVSGANLAKVDLTGADLSAVYGAGTNFQSAELNRANLSGAYLPEGDFRLTRLNGADLRLAAIDDSDFFMAEMNGANLRSASLSRCQITECSFVNAILAQTNFEDTVLRDSDLTGANMRGANLTGAGLVGANLSSADLSESRVFGTSVWKTVFDGTKQNNLIITPDGEPELTTDNLKIAQFIYLMMNNEEIRDIIDTIHSKVVLLLGRFTPERKPVLDAIRDELRKRDYISVMFDFTRPSSKTFIGTIKTLASMTRFVIADLTDARVVVQEIEMILREYPSVPVQPILIADQRPPSVILDYSDFDSFLDIFLYRDREMLLSNLGAHVVAPAENKAAEIASRRAQMREKLFGQTAD